MQKNENNCNKEPHAVKDHTATETNQEARAESTVAVPSQRQAGNFSQTTKLNSSHQAERNPAQFVQPEPECSSRQDLPNQTGTRVNHTSPLYNRSLWIFDNECTRPPVFPNKHYEVARDAVLRVYH